MVPRSATNEFSQECLNALADLNVATAKIISKEPRAPPLRQEASSNDDRATRSARSSHIDCVSKEQMKQKTEEARLQAQKEMANHTEQFESELKTRANNEMKKLTGEKGRLQKRLENAEGTLKSTEDELKKTKDDLKNATDKLRQKEAHIRLQQKRIDELESLLPDHGSRAKSPLRDHDRLQSTTLETTSNTGSSTFASEPSTKKRTAHRAFESSNSTAQPVPGRRRIIQPNDGYDVNEMLHRMGR